MKPKRLSPQQLKTQQQLDRISAAFKQAMAGQRFADAMQQALRAHRLIPQAVAPLSDAATAAVKGGLWQDAVVYAKKALQRNPEHINSLDALAHAYGGLSDWENCRIHGLQALQLRDRQMMAANPQPPVLPNIKPESGGKKLISFSLFGDRSEYLEPAVMNTELVDEIYPGWVCRFYVDGSVPETALQRLRDNGAEVVRVAAELKNWPGTMWRFLALDDPQTERVIFRDADSVISQREAAAVAQWQAGNRYFHTIRDAATHTELMLAGLWGAVGGAVPDMHGKMAAWLEKPLVSRHFADQYFLREVVWPYARQSLFATDSLFGFGEVHAFPLQWANYDSDRHHVGCNEGNSHIAGKLDMPEGTHIVWRLFSRISPFFGEDYAEQLLAEERLVCAYETTVQNGGFDGYIPRRYSKGLANGLSKITVAKVGQEQSDG